MTLFNVRLGWWLGNPGEGRTLPTAKVRGSRSCRCSTRCSGRRPTPAQIRLSFGRRALRESRSLRDGAPPLPADRGQRRRLRPEFRLRGPRQRRPQDLARSRRRHHARSVGRLRPRPKDGNRPGCGRAVLRHRRDRLSGRRTAALRTGVLVYVKSGYHGIESAAVRAYAIANPTFPHQSTGDQFFSELAVRKLSRARIRDRRRLSQPRVFRRETADKLERGRNREGIGARVAGIGGKSALACRRARCVRTAHDTSMRDARRRAQRALPHAARLAD